MPVCSQCGAPLDPNATQCKYCGEPVASSAPPPPPAQQQAPFQQPPMMPPPMQQPPMQQPMYMNGPNMQNDGIDPSWPIKSKTAAGLLAIFLGGLGIHKFYLGQVGMGIVYLIFCWTYIPAILAFIEGIIYLTSNEHNFQVKNKVRLR